MDRMFQKYGDTHKTFYPDSVRRHKNALLAYRIIYFRLYIIEAQHEVINILLANDINVMQPTLNIHGEDLRRERLVMEDLDDNGKAINNNGM